MVIMLWPPVQYRGATSMFDTFFNAWLRPCPCPCNHDYCWFYFVKQELLFLCLIDKIRWFLDFEGPEKLILPPRSLFILFWSTRIVDSVFFLLPEKLINKNRWFWAFERPEMLILLKYRINILYPPWHSGIADSHFVVSLLNRNNKMGHRINKMDIHFNKVGHRNSKVGHRNNKVGVYETTKWGSVPVSS